MERIVENSKAIEQRRPDPSFQRLITGKHVMKRAREWGYELKANLYVHAQ